MTKLSKNLLRKLLKKCSVDKYSYTTNGGGDVYTTVVDWSKYARAVEKAVSKRAANLLLRTAGVDHLQQ